MGSNAAPVFREIQKPRQWWIMLIILGIMVLSWYMFVVQIIQGEPVGTNPGPDWVVWLVWIVFGLIFPLGWWAMRLVVEVYQDRVQVRYVPFVNRKIPLSDILGAEARTYEPLRHYGGWGIRFRIGHSRAYTVRGNRGVELLLHGGQRLILGSQQPEALAAAISVRLGR